MAISVGSVEVDVIPNTRGIYSQLQRALVPAATRAGQDAGDAAGRSFGPAMQAQVGNVGLRIGQQIGQQIANRITASLRTSITNGITQAGRTARPAATRQGDETGGAFSRALKTRLEAAFRSLPRADVRMSDTGFDADMARLRARIETLSGKRIGIDVDVAAAVTEITDIEERLRRLGAQHPNVQVRADTAAALAELAAVRAAVDAVDGDTATVDVDTRSATAGFNALTAAAIAFGPAILPVLPVVAAGLGAIAAAATAAGAGIGGIALVAVPAFKQMATVLQAQKAAQDAATNASLRGGQASSQAAQRSLQMASAQQALATAQRNAARQIADAERGVADAERQAAQANAQAAQQVRQARQSLADAYAQAAERMQQANAQVASAERDLTQAQRTERQAQLDLTAARKEASRQLEDMNNSLVDAQLSQKQAEFALADAKRQRDAVFANSSSTDDQKARAQLAYDQALQALKEQQLQTQRLEKDTKAANKAGVDGSKTVKDAQQRLADAQQNVADKTRALKTAQDNIAKTQIQNTRAIADAQQKLSEAQKNVAETQRQGAENIAKAQERVVAAQQSGADSIASAQRQIASASLSAAGGVDQAAIAQAKYQQALAKLSPAARQTFRAFLDLKKAFGDWSKSLQPAVMPIFTRALVGLRNTLPTLTPFVTAAADAIKGLQDRASSNLKKPFWQGFKKDLQGSVKPAITGLGIAFGNVITGMAGIVDAFLPHMDGISSHLQRITKKFADWGKGLKGSPEFERFLSYSAEHGPQIADAFGKIFGALLDIGSAISPLSGPLLTVIGGLAQGVGWLAQHAPELVIAMYGLYVATKLWALWQIIANGAVKAFQLVAGAGPWGWIVLAIGLVVLAVIYMYRHFAWFRDAVQVVWQALKTGAMWLWTNGIKPAFDAIGTIVVWLWQHIIKPYINGFVIPQFRALARVVVWLWTNIVKPHFHFIADLIVWWWKVVLKPQFNAVKAGLSGLGEAFKALYEKVIKPVWQKYIAPTISNAWKHGIKPALDGLKQTVGRLGDAFKSAASAIDKNWSKIKAATKAPINFVIGTVWNKGVVPAWKRIDKWVPGLPKLDTLPLLAQGGTVPARPGVFNRPTAIVGEGRPQHPEFVIPTDPRYRGRALALWQAAGGQLMADGGILGDVFGGIKSIGGKIGGFFKSATSFLTNPGKALDSLLGRLLKPLDAIKSSGWGKLAIGLPKRIFSGLKDLVSFGGDSGGPIGGTIPKGRRLAIISQALAAAHVPPPGTLPQWQAGLNTLITRESGWNPRAINRTDINAKNGIPSQGLAQTIPPTFAHYVPKSLRSRGILDPVANVAAAIRYIVSRYGNITRVQQANANLPPKGYDSGGFLQPGLNLAYNGTGRPEPVFTTQQANALTSLAAGGGAVGPARFEGDLYLDSGEFLGRVRGEAQQVVSQNNRQIMTALSARPRR